MLLGNNAEQQKRCSSRCRAWPRIVNGKQLTLAQLADECITRHGSDVLDGEINRKILAAGAEPQAADVDRAGHRCGSCASGRRLRLRQGGRQARTWRRWLESVTEQPGATVDLYVRDAVWPSVALKKLVGSKVEVTDEDLRKGYESNYGERVEVQAIVFSDMRQAQKVWDLARNNNTEPFFAELAQQYSIEPSSRANGGKVPPIRRYGGSPLVEEEAFKLKAGEIIGNHRRRWTVHHPPLPRPHAARANRLQRRPRRAGQRHPGEEAPHR